MDGDEYSIKTDALVVKDKREIVFVYPADTSPGVFPVPVSAFDIDYISFVFIL